MKGLPLQYFVISSMAAGVQTLVARPAGVFLGLGTGVGLANRKEDIDFTTMLIILLLFWFCVCLCCCRVCVESVKTGVQKAVADIMEANELAGMEGLKKKFETKCPEGSEKRAKYESEAFVSKWTALFQEADKNGDKVLSLQEMEQCKELQFHGSMKNILKTWDINADQKLNEDEFVTMMKCFAWFEDSDKEEAIQAIKKAFDNDCPEGSEEHAKYESEEFVSKWRSLFQEVDKNGDKALPMEELREYHRGMTFGMASGTKITESEFIMLMQAVTSSMDFVVLFGEKLMSKEGEVNTAKLLEGKSNIMLYFTAQFSPALALHHQLAHAYKASAKAGSETIVIFVSADRDEASFHAYYGEMPWHALPYSDRDRFKALYTKFGVSGIPTLLVLGSDGALVTRNGSAAYPKFL